MYNIYMFYKMLRKAEHIWYPLHNPLMHLGPLDFLMAMRYSLITPQFESN